jgi:hypothetical protein
MITKRAFDSGAACCAVLAGAMCLSARSAETGEAPAAGGTGAVEPGGEGSKPAGVRFEGTDLHLGSAPPVSFHGFASQGFLYSPDYNYLGPTKDGSFQYTEVGVNLSWSPLERTRIAVQGFTFDLGNVGNFEMLLDYASLEYAFDPAVGVRFGRIRRPGGIYNHIQDVDLARTYVLLPQGMYDARWRDFSTSTDGGEIFGSVPLGKAGGLSYEFYAGYMSLSREGGVARSIENGLPPAPMGRLDGIDRPLVVGGQLWWSTPVDGLRVGLSVGDVLGFGYDVTVPAPPTFAPAQMNFEGDIPFQQASIEYVLGRWTFQAEYFTYRFGAETSMGGMRVSEDTTSPDTWYVAVSRRLTSWLEAGAYYSEYYADTSDRESAAGYQKDLAVSLRFDPTDWWIWKLEGHHLNGTAQIQDDARNPVRDDDGWWLLAVKTTVSF